MDTTPTLELTPKVDAEYEAVVDPLIAQINQVRVQMADDQREIERLRAETDAILAHMQAA